MAGVTVGCSYCAAAVVVPQPPPVSMLPLAERDEPAPLPSAAAFEELDRPRRRRRVDDEDDRPIRSPRRSSGSSSGAWVLAILVTAAVGALFLVAYLTKVKTRGEGEAAVGTAMVGGLLCFGLLFYFIPTIVAVLRSHPNTAPIVIVNLFLGWSLVGFAVALAWAFTNNQPSRHEHFHYR